MRKALLILAAMVAGCAPVSKRYVEADQATYDAVAPEYLGYVEADGKLTNEQKARRAETVRSWKARIDEGGSEKSTEAAPPAAEPR